MISVRSVLEETLKNSEVDHIRITMHENIREGVLSCSCGGLCKVEDKTHAVGNSYNPELICIIDINIAISRIPMRLQTHQDGKAFPWPKYNLRNG